MSILDGLSKHSMFSETLDTLNRDPSTAHQMKGFDFAQNFPGAVPGGINTPASFVGPALSKGYQYGQELSRAMLDGFGGVTIGDALSKAKTQSDANIQGMFGKGFDMDTYNQNVKDFNIADVNFANSFGLDNLFGSSAMANEPTVDVDSVKSAINAARNREALNKQGLLSLDDAGLTPESYEEFAEVAKPGFNKQFAKQLGTTALGLITGNPFVGLIARGLGALAGKGGLTGIRGGVDLRGDTGFDTFRRSTSLADFMQRQRDKKAREAAAARGSVKELQSRIDRGDFDGGGKDDAPGGAASNQDAARGGQYG
jgi:hypothetical protein